MMHLKAKCDLWIGVFEADKSVNIRVVEYAFQDAHPIGWVKISDVYKMLCLPKGDTLTFKAIADGSDPYAQLATRYPEWFEIVP